MFLTLIREDAIHRITLPERRSGQHWVTFIDDAGVEQRLIGIDGIDGRWILKTNKQASILGDGDEVLRETALEPNKFYVILERHTESKLLLHTEPTTADRRTFSRHVLAGEGPWRIGRAEGATIRFQSPFVSARHAEIVANPDGLELHDAGSSNGTFLNGSRIKEAVRVRPGDVVSVSGLEIVVGAGFIALNDPDGLVSVDSRALRPLSPQATEPAADEEIEESSPAVKFLRSPRFKRDIATAVIGIDSPPQRNDADEMPLMMVLGPALTMGMASAFMGVFAVMNVMINHGSMFQAMPSVMMAFFMLLGMVLWPILSNRQQKQRKAEKEVVRQEKYRAYLARTNELIAAERDQQAQILAANTTKMSECIERIRVCDRKLWERMISHSDFLRVRLGIGSWPLDANLKYAERHFSVDDDDLLDEMYAVAEQPLALTDVPVSVSLREEHVAGIIGERARERDLVRGIVLQLAALHSYDELKLVFIYDECEAAYWDFVRLLPHSWRDDKEMRFVATRPSEVKGLGAYLDSEISAREALRSDDELADAQPYYVVFALSRELTKKAGFIDRILAAKKNLGFSVLACFDELKFLPKECHVVIESKVEPYKIYDRDDTTQSSIEFAPEPDLVTDARELAECLANTELESAQAAFALPDMITFLELFGVGRVEHLNSLLRWKENNPVQSLEAAVGVDTSGEQFKLDIHERFHGPHGLIAGMTGSGKSEFIMTYILSMALNYHPNEVAFVLIDYKGGGMANAFLQLPHVAGTITNLDGAAVNRSLISIQSELKRRQALFNQAGQKNNVSNIDIYKYQSLYREGLVDEPLPHLLIISDEFAELKTQQPDFMAQLVSAARIGRSLGVHLILATQKPSGVVDDQIWSNTRFRVCLKVQETADSMEVIKRPDAASLDRTGRFYVQVGFDELFELGQSAWAGAPYYPSDRSERAYDYSAVVIDNLGQPVRQTKLDKQKALVARPSKQLDEVTRYLIGLAKEEGVRTRPLWLEPMAAIITLDQLKKKYPAKRADASLVLNPVIGEYDDPANQRQALLRLPLSEGNAVIFGATGSGKTTLLTTALYSMLEETSPEMLSAYILDFGAETLSAFKTAPQVGDVLTSGDAEKITNLFKMLDKEIGRRKQLFSEFGGDYVSYLAASAESLESIVVVIHNYSAFTETYDDKDDVVAYLSREGTKYGIYFILTTTSPGGVRYRTLQNFKQLLVLQLNDSTDYAAVLGNTGGVTPSRTKGRGIFRSDHVYEFQTAHVTTHVDRELAMVRDWCKQQREQWAGHTAKHIPTLPSVVTPEFLQSTLSGSANSLVPVGIDKADLSTVCFDFSKPFVSMVLSESGEAGSFLEGLAEMLGDRLGDDAIGIIDPLDELASSGLARIDGDPVAINKAAGEIFEEMLRRNNERADARAAGATSPEFEDRVWIIGSMSAYLAALDPETRQKFATMLEKCDSGLRANFILADSASNASAYTFEPWAKQHLTGGTGIWVGGGFASQYVLQPSKTTSELYQEVDPGFGYVLTKGKPRLVKLLSAEAAMEEVG